MKAFNISKKKSKIRDSTSTTFQVFPQHFGFFIPTCQIYHEKNFDDYDFNWKLIYRIPRFATLEAKIRIFQYKLLNNVLYLNKKLFQLGSVCSFCDLYRLYISEKVALPVLNPQSAIFGFTDVLDHN